ncbi:MAG: glycosyltransferase [Planctomycetota bacterium]
MRITVLTSLYPSPERPYEGVFAERRWVGMRDRGHAVGVVQPLPWAPGWIGGRRGELARRPATEQRAGIAIERPRYLHVPKLARRNAQAFARVGVRAILAGERPDVVVADYAWPASAAVRTLAAHGLPCVVNGRGSDVLEVAGEAGLGAELGANLAASAGWCAVSADLVARMDELAGQPGRGVLVPNGVDTIAFRPADRGSARRSLGLAPDGALVLVVGHLIPRKDPVLALKTFLAGAPADARLVFLGRGPLEAEVAEHVEHDGANARVRLMGEVPPERLAEWYAASDALLLTSSREGRPNVVIEALAAGRPAVATAAGGTAEVLGALAERLLVASRDPAVIGARLGAVLRDPPTPTELRGLVEHLSWDASLDALEGVLQAARPEAVR